MDFALAPIHELTRKSVREFAEREIRPESRRYDESQEYPMAWARRMGELGLLGVAVPEKYGGAGLDSVCSAVTHEELWLGAYCLPEPGSGSDAAAMRTTAKLDGDEWVLNGTKIIVTNALHASLLVVYARTGPQKHDISAFLVPKPAKGLTELKKEDKLGIRASDTMMLGFEDVRIPKENLRGTQEKGFNVALATLDGGRIGIAAQALGIGQAAYDEAARYAKGG